LGKISPFIMSLTGRLITAYDPTKIVQSDQQGVEVNFQVLNNLQYTDRGIMGTPGMSKINSATALTNFPKIENVFQFNKTQPDESHVMVQAYDINEDNSNVFKNDTVIPNTGDFNPTAVHTDVRTSASITAFAANGLSRTTVTSAGHDRQNGEQIVISGTTSYSGIFVVENEATDTFDIVTAFVADDATGTWATRVEGRFSNAPIAHMCYCNGQETMIWGGDQSKVAGFILFDANADTFTRDYSEQVKNTRTDAPNIATMTQDGAGTPKVSLYVGSVLPIESITFYIVTPNIVAGALTVDYWDGSGWQTVTNLVDGTVAGGIPFSKIGTVTFDSTEAVAKTLMVEGILGFWFRVQVTNCTDTTTISRVTLGVPFQPLQDLWDQLPRQFAKIYHFDTDSNYNDITVNLSQDSFFYDTTSSAGDDSSYFDVGNLASPDLIFGAFERVQGIQFKLIPGQKNTTAATTISVSYWTGAAWAALTVTDNTSVGSISLSQAGFVTWSPREENIEFKQSIVGGEGLYFYKVSFDKTLSASPVNIFFSSYIPVQRLVQGYRFSLHAKSRLFLFGDETGDKNKMIVSSVNTVNVFNGRDSGDPIFFGQDDVSINAAVEIFARFTSNLQSVIVVCQSNSTYVLFGSNPNDWSTLPISTTIGCSAPLTMKASPIGFEFVPLQTKQVAIWLHSNGVYMFDVEHGLNLISNDIIDLFDQRKSGSINLTHIGRAAAVWNLVNGEYFWHMFFPTNGSTVNNTEKAFDLKRRKWFTVKRTPSGSTNKDIHAGAEIIASNGSNFTYGVDESGYLQRLNNGTDYDGNNIESQFKVGDIAFSGGDTLLVSKVRHLQMPQVAKTVTTNDITVTHFADGQTSGNSFVLSPLKTGRRLAIPSMSQGINLDPGVFHSFDATLITNDETVPFEPLFLSAKVETVRVEEGEVS
jgi:hypothetical protein